MTSSCTQGLPDQGAWLPCGLVMRAVDYMGRRDAVRCPPNSNQYLVAETTAYTYAGCMHMYKSYTHMCRPHTGATSLKSGSQKE